MATGTALAITVPRYYFFPAMAGYACLGPARSVFLGLLDRLPERDPLEDVSDVEPEETRIVDYEELGRADVPDEGGRPGSLLGPRSGPRIEPLD